MPTTVLGLLGVLLCAVAVTSQVTPQTDFGIKGFHLKFGGWSPEALVTKEVKNICMKVKPDIEKAVGTNFPVYIPRRFRRQIVAGTNYLVKVVVGHVCVHAIIFEALPCNGGNLTVTGVQYPKALSDPLIPFRTRLTAHRK